METRVRRMTKRGAELAIGSLQSGGGKKGAGPGPEQQAGGAGPSCSPVTIYPH
ncbi:MAG: hypothetical protein SVK44_08145 [Nitrospirota bacterium]|nr:hypothetical protein [Nitrospirota bacterium]